MEIDESYTHFQSCKDLDCIICNISCELDYEDLKKYIKRLGKYDTKELYEKYNPLIVKRVMNRHYTRTFKEKHQRHAKKSPSKKYTEMHETFGHNIYKPTVTPHSPQNKKAKFGLVEIPINVSESAYAALVDQYTDTQKTHHGV